MNRLAAGILCLALACAALVLSLVPPLGSAMSFGLDAVCLVLVVLAYWLLGRELRSNR